MQIIELLKKVIAQEKSEREIGNLAAAETFAAKVQELLTKHKLNMTDVEFAAEEANEPILAECVSSDDLLCLNAKTKNDRWHSILISTIADANFCQVICGKSNRFVIVGRDSDRQVVKMMFTYLAQACVEMARREANSARCKIGFFSGDRRGKSAANRVFISSFKTGFALAINTRLQAKRLELKAGAQSQGLIRIDQLELATNTAMKRLFPNARQVSERVTSRSAVGYYAGKSYGSAVGINSTARLGA